MEICPPQRVARAEVDVAWRKPEFKRAAAQALARGEVGPVRQVARPELDDHPVCQDPRLAVRVAAHRKAQCLESDVAERQRAIERQSSRLVRRMDDIMAVLQELGYLDGWSLTDAGRMLASVHREQDLLVAEVIKDGVLDGLSDTEFAAASVLVYEHRDRSTPLSPICPSEWCASAVVRGVVASSLVGSLGDRSEGARLASPAVRRIT